MSLLNGIKPGTKMCFMCFTVLLMLLHHGRPQCYLARPRTHKLMSPSCCHNVSKRPFAEAVDSCFKQNASTFPNCKVDAFIFITVSGEKHCVDPTAMWLPRRFGRLENNGICCQIL